MQQVDTYLIFNGNCADAMRFYERTLGGKLEVMMTQAESPVAAQTPPEDANRIMHARLALGDRILMASDNRTDMTYEGMRGFSITLTYPTADEGRRIFDRLAEGGRVTMPMQQTFWAEAFGMVVDRFGTPWMVNAGPQSV